MCCQSRFLGAVLRIFSLQLHCFFQFPVNFALPSRVEPRENSFVSSAHKWRAAIKDRVKRFGKPRLYAKGKSVRGWCRYFAPQHTIPWWGGIAQE